MDRALFVNMEGFFHLEGHARPADAHAHQAATSEVHDHDAPIADEQKRVTAILVSTREDWQAAALAKQINEDSVGRP